MSYSEYYFCSRRETENRYQEYGGKIQQGGENRYQEYGDAKMAGTGSITGKSSAPAHVDPKVSDENYERFTKLMKFCKENNVKMEYRKKILNGAMTTDEYLAIAAPQNFQTEAPVEVENSVEEAPEAPETPVEEPVAEQPVESTAEPLEKPRKRSKKKSEEEPKEEPKEEV